MAIFFRNCIFEPRPSIFFERRPKRKKKQRAPFGAPRWLLSVYSSVSFIRQVQHVAGAVWAGCRLLISAYFNGCGGAGWLSLQIRCVRVLKKHDPRIITEHCVLLLVSVFEVLHSLIVPLVLQHSVFPSQPHVLNSSPFTCIAHVCCNPP